MSVLKKKWMLLRTKQKDSTEIKSFKNSIKNKVFLNIVMYVYVYTYIFDAMFIVFVYNMYSVEQRTEDWAKNPEDI